MAFLNLLSKEDYDAAQKATRGFVPQLNEMASNIIPEGKYICQLAEVKVSSKENGQWLTLLFEISVGKHAGRVLPKACNISSTDRLSWFASELAGRLGYTDLVPSKPSKNFDILAVLDAALDDLQGKYVELNHVHSVKKGVEYWNNYFQSVVSEQAVKNLSK